MNTAIQDANCMDAAETEKCPSIFCPTCGEMLLGLDDICQIALSVSKEADGGPAFEMVHPNMGAECERRWDIREGDEATCEEHPSTGTTGPKDAQQPAFVVSVTTTKGPVDGNGTREILIKVEFPPKAMKPEVRIVQMIPSNAQSD